MRRESYQSALAKRTIFDLTFRASPPPGSTVLVRQLVDIDGWQSFRPKACSVRCVEPLQVDELDAPIRRRRCLTG